MDYISEYLGHVAQVLKTAGETQNKAMHDAAKLICDATTRGSNIFAFGCSHAGLIALELYYRTGGLATINPIRAAGLCLDVDPATLTSKIERLPQYGIDIIDSTPLKDGDVIIIHSVSGRNTVAVDAAIRSREKGAKVIVLTNMNTSKAVPSRHPCGKNLYEFGDIVIDNCGDFGDSSTLVPGIPEKIGPTSTAIGAALMYAVVVEAAALIAESGRTVPVYVSANVPGGDEHNAKMLKEYKEHIFYMGH